MRTAVVVLAVLMTAVPAGAYECEPSTSRAGVCTHGPCVPLDTGPYYVVAWWDMLVGSFGVFAYEESNGIAGLQRADKVHDDTCGGQIRGDTIVF